ncbi:molybdenum cofactor guanylyltransferase MobA [Roseateles sp. BYS180W]|uniref:Molybdenum cofactor guanylyltransferase n=1 Tax=Roseateles rivi TaxID=3299028 RepID=A0ABW7FYB9_9BURK
MHAPPWQSPRPEQLTGLILAGGQGQRMGGVDKGWVMWPAAQAPSQALVQHVLQRLAPQVGTVWISANRNAERYATLGVERVFSDALPGHLGPLAGWHAALQALHAQTARQGAWLLSVPCDAPLLSPTLAARLCAALCAQDRAAYAQTADGPQPVFALLHSSLHAELASALQGQQRRVLQWLQQVGARAVLLDAAGDATAFANVNTPEALHQPKPD